MLKGVSESLAGRSVYFTMYPFTQRETAKQIRKKPFLYNFFENRTIPDTDDVQPIKAEDVLRGGMPSVCLDEVKDRRLWFKGFEQTYLERDVRDFS